MDSSSNDLGTTKKPGQRLDAPPTAGGGNHYEEPFSLEDEEVDLLWSSRQPKRSVDENRGDSAGDREESFEKKVKGEEPAISQCRICHTQTKEVLITPCACRGTMGLCHESCLTRWLLRKESILCEVCSSTYHCTPTYSVPDQVNPIKSFLLRRLALAERQHEVISMGFWAAIYCLLFNIRKRIGTIIRYTVVIFGWGVVMPYAQYVCLWQLRTMIGSGMGGGVVGQVPPSPNGTDVDPHHVRRALWSTGNWTVSDQDDGFTATGKLILTTFTGNGLAIWCLGALFTTASVLILFLQIGWFQWLMENIALLTELELRPLRPREVAAHENRRREDNGHQPRLGFGALVMDEDAIEADMDGEAPQRRRAEIAAAAGEEPDAPDVGERARRGGPNRRMEFQPRAQQGEVRGGDGLMFRELFLDEAPRRGARVAGDDDRDEDGGLEGFDEDDAPDPAARFAPKSPGPLPPPPNITQDLLIDPDDASTILAKVRQNLPEGEKYQNAEEDDRNAVAFALGLRGDVVTGVVCFAAFLSFTKVQWFVWVQLPAYVGYLSLTLVPTAWDCFMACMACLEESWVYVTSADLPNWMQHTIVNMLEETTLWGSVFAVTVFGLQTGQLTSAVGPPGGVRAAAALAAAQNAPSSDLTWAPVIAQWYANLEGFMVSPISTFLAEAPGWWTHFSSKLVGNYKITPLLWGSGLVYLYMILAGVCWSLQPTKKRSWAYWLKYRLVLFKQTLRVIIAHLVRLIVIPPILGVLVFFLLTPEVEQGPPTAWYPWPRIVQMGSGTWNSSSSGAGLGSSSGGGNSTSTSTTSSSGSLHRSQIKSGFKSRNFYPITLETGIPISTTSSSSSGGGGSGSSSESTEEDANNLIPSASTVTAAWTAPSPFISGNGSKQWSQVSPPGAPKAIFPVLVVAKNMRAALSEITEMWYERDMCPDVFVLPRVDGAGESLGPEELRNRARLMGMLNSISPKRSLCFYPQSTSGSTTSEGDTYSHQHLHHCANVDVEPDWVSAVRYYYTVGLTMIVYHVPLFSDPITFAECLLIGSLAIIVVTKSLNSIFLRMDPKLPNIFGFDHPHQLEENGAMFTLLTSTTRKYILTTIRTSVLVGLAIIGILVPALQLLKDLDSGRFPLQYSIEIGLLIIKAGVSTGWFAQGPVQIATVIDLFHGFLFGFLTEHLDLRRFFNNGNVPSAAEDFTFPVRLLVLAVLYWVSMILVCIALVVLPTFAGHTLLRAILAAETSEAGLIQHGADGQPDADLANMVFFFSIDSVMLLSGALFILWTGGRIVVEYMRRHLVPRIRLHALKRRYHYMKFTAYFGCELVNARIGFRGGDFKFAISTASPMIHEFGLTYEDLVKEASSAQVARQVASMTGSAQQPAPAEANNGNVAVGGEGNDANDGAQLQPGAARHLLAAIMIPRQNIDVAATGGAAARIGGAEQFLGAVKQLSTNLMAGELSPEQAARKALILIRMQKLFDATKEMVENGESFYPPDGGTQTEAFASWQGAQSGRTQILPEEDVYFMAVLVASLTPRWKRYLRPIMFVIFGIPLLLGFFALLSVSMYALVPPSIRNIQQCSVIDRIWYGSEDNVLRAATMMTGTNIVAFFFTWIVIGVTLPFSGGFWAHADKIRKTLMVHVMVRNVFGFNLKLVYKEICAPCMLLLFPLCFAPVCWDAYVYPWLLSAISGGATSTSLMNGLVVADPDAASSFLAAIDMKLEDLLTNIPFPPFLGGSDNATSAAAMMMNGSTSHHQGPAFLQTQPTIVTVLFLMHHYQLDRFALVALWLIVVPRPGFITSVVTLVKEIVFNKNGGGVAAAAAARQNDVVQGGAGGQGANEVPRPFGGARGASLWDSLSQGKNQQPVAVPTPGETRDESMRVEPHRDEAAGAKTDPGPAAGDADASTMGPTTEKQDSPSDAPATAGGASPPAAAKPAVAAQPLTPHVLRPPNQNNGPTWRQRLQRAVTRTLHSWVRRLILAAYSDFESNTIVGIRIYCYGSVPMGRKRGAVDVKTKDRIRKDDLRAEAEDRMDFIA